MAVGRLVIDGFGQFEPNHFTAPRDGRIEAQCALNATDFTTANPCENGMVVVVDKAAKEIKLYTSGSVLPLGIVYSTEQLYDERHPGLKNYSSNSDGFYPRVGYPAFGDTFTTNVLSYDSSTWATLALFKTAMAAYATTPVYAEPHTDGSWKLSGSEPSTLVYAQVVEVTTMPDGQYALKLQIFCAQ